MESFRLRNVKAFLDSGTIQLRPITLVIGQNSSGKSSLLRFPLVLKQTFLDDSVAPLLFYGKSIDYGNYEDVVFGHDEIQEMHLELSISTVDLLSYLPPTALFSVNDQVRVNLENSPELTINFSIFLHDNELRIEGLIIRIADKILISTYEDSNLGDDIVVKCEISNNGALKVKGDPRIFKTMFRKFLIEPILINFFTDETEDGNGDNAELIHKTYSFYETLLRALVAYFNDLSKEINYIGPNRLSPERSYRYRENAVNYVGRDGEFAPVILAQDQRSGGKVLENVSDWLSEHLNLKLEVDASSDTFKLMVTDVANLAENDQDEAPVRNNLIDVGHGISQLIPILVQVFMDRELTRDIRRKLGHIPSLNLIEQPELHLHPAAQAALADLFIAGIRKTGDGEEPKQKYLIETHSEHMLLRLRRRIVEGTLDPNDVAIYYTEKNKDGKSVDVRKLEIEPDGSIPDWPEGLFEEDYREVLELREAMRKKQKGGRSLPW